MQVLKSTIYIDDGTAKQVSWVQFGVFGRLIAYNVAAITKVELDF